MKGEIRPVAVLYLAAAGAALLLSACGSVAPRPSATSIARAPDAVRAPDAARAPEAVRAPARPSTGGGYYLNDGPGDNPPPHLELVPDAVPKLEPLRRATMRPYVAMGQSYVPMTELKPYKERGVASWYGRRYHGQQTSSGERYDMYAMTAAHPVLPIPSYVRVTNVANQRSVIVRVNDRGPFHSDRLIDLSYTAAYKLGVLGGGKAIVEVESISPDAGTQTTPIYAETPSVPPAALVAAPAEPLPDPALTLVSLAPQSAPPAEQQPGTGTAVVTASATAMRQGLYLQLGAFSSPDNAGSFLARLRAESDWLAPALQVVPNDGWYRVHAGPYASVAEARAAAARIGEAFGIKPVVVTR